jgi:dTDP-4-amino-4,6-dideoxygalactose transaminase
MSALILGLGPGDEVILPSFTFVSSANAFVLRGAVPVFVDIREDTLNLDERLIAEAVTSKTRAIVPVHYAGVACEMDEIMRIANAHSLCVVEDAAQGVMARYKGRALGSIGHLGAFSFHETKNVICGEGGALLVNQPELVQKAEIVREKGTDRSRFFRGEVDKYTWQEVGSSFLPGEVSAAFLAAQFEEAESITDGRLLSWNRYHSMFDALEHSGLVRRPVVPETCQHNAHMYYLLLPDIGTRGALIKSLREADIYTVFHYVPLHSSPAGQHFGRYVGDMRVTESSADRLLRLPMWVGITPEEQTLVAERIYRFFGRQSDFSPAQ